LLRGEDAGYRDSSYGIRKSLIFQIQLHDLYIYIGKLKLATCYFNSFDASTRRDRIFLIVVLLFVVTLLGIAAMKLDNDFKNNISKHAQLLFAIRQNTLNNRGSGAF
jgi:uncharacterized membrane protein YwzB